MFNKLQWKVSGMKWQQKHEHHHRHPQQQPDLEIILSFLAAWFYCQKISPKICAISRKKIQKDWLRCFNYHSQSSSILIQLPAVPLVFREITETLIEIVVPTASIFFSLNSQGQQAAGLKFFWIRKIISTLAFHFLKKMHWNWFSLQIFTEIDEKIG